jgi:hypothetical protein
LPIAKEESGEFEDAWETYKSFSYNYQQVLQG